MRVESWTEKIIRLSLARAGNEAVGRAVELISMGKPENHPEVVAQSAIGNALITAAAAIHEAIETELLPNPYPEVSNEVAPERSPRTG